MSPLHCTRSFTTIHTFDYGYPLSLTATPTMRLIPGHTREQSSSGLTGKLARNRLVTCRFLLGV